MLKVILVAMFLFSFSAFAETIKVNGHMFVFKEGFRCEAALGEEDTKIPVMILEDEKQQKLIVFPNRAFNLISIPSANDIKMTLLEHPEYFTDEKKIDILECDEKSVSLKQLQSYTKRPH